MARSGNEMLTWFLCFCLVDSIAGLVGFRVVKRPLTTVKSWSSDVGVFVYDAQLLFSDLVETQLESATPTSLGVLYAAGLLTSFSPCAVSLLPLTLAYLGGAESKTSSSKLLKSIFYAGGLAVTLASLGLIAASLGQVFGSSATYTFGGSLPSLISASVTIAMGLNLLEIIQISFPSPGDDEKILPLASKLPDAVQAFVLGGTSALISSPCSSPVLASLLAYVASSGRPSLGGAYLFVYSLGYATPVVAAGGLSGAANTLASSRGLPWINNAMAAALVAIGTYSFLEALFK